jgi:fatty-acyl-CoA synthase
MDAHDALHEGCSAADLVIRAIRRGGDRPAFVLDDEVLSYRAFGERLGRFVAALEARGLRHGDTVATLSSNRPEASWSRRPRT